MCTNPKYRLWSGVKLVNGEAEPDGRIKPVKKTYQCDNYIQALTVQENLKQLTGTTCRIEKGLPTGWKVVFPGDSVVKDE